MFTKHRLAEVAALFGDPGRAGMVMSLWDGTARPAGELARIAGVAPATASAHLARLVSGGLLRVERRGRHRYYRLAGPAVAQALESLAGVLSPHAPVAHVEEAEDPIRRARLCYDHVAGRLGVAIGDALATKRWLALDAGAYVLGPAGRRGFERLGVDVAALERGRRPLLRSCIDWTERREHLGGALGAALANQLLERDWLRRQRGVRTLLVTTAGRAGLREALVRRDFVTVYRGKSVGMGLASYTFRYWLQADHTLSSEELDSFRTSFLAFAKDRGIELR
jgi:DNA-binding transcriptional ArsR family regulator